VRHLLTLLAASSLFGCAASDRLPGAPGLEIIVKAEPSAFSFDAAGAQKMQAATGCEVEALRPVAPSAYLFRLWPTKRADVQQCLRTVQATPGVAYAQPNVEMKQHKGTRQ
jgi:hypothetical protein